MISANTLIAILVMVAVAIMLSGWIGYSMYLITGRIKSIPDTPIQITLFYLLGATGLLLCHRSTRFIKNKKVAYRLLIMGLFSILVAWIAVESLF